MGNLDETWDGLHSGPSRSLTDTEGTSHTPEWYDEGIYFGTEVHQRSNYALAIPNESLRAASSLGDLAIFICIGEAWAQVAMHFMPSAKPLVVDIGCGCGKIARFLMLNPKLSYVGLDVFEPAISWCTAEFSKVYGDRAKFIRLDAISDLYNPNGNTSAENIDLPVDGETVDLVICASLFTHLLESEMHRYLNEVSRMLKNNGRMLASIHAEPPTGSRFSGDARRIDMTFEMFIESCQRANLQLLQHVGNLYTQEVFVFEKISA